MSAEPAGSRSCATKWKTTITTCLPLQPSPRKSNSEVEKQSVQCALPPGCRWLDLAVRKSPSGNIFCVLPSRCTLSLKESPIKSPLRIKNEVLLKLLYFTDIKKYGICIHHLTADFVSWQIIFEFLDAFLAGKDTVIEMDATFMKYCDRNKDRVLFAEHKTATLAADIAQKALKASNPMGWIELAVGGIIGLITVLMTTTSDLTKTVEVLSDEEQKLVKAAKETADAYEKQQEARKNTMDGISAEMGHLSNLAEELQTIADKNGVVKDTDKARAEFILGELNNALGTEYTMTGNIIGQYDELVDGVNELIESKKAQLLLEANEEAYTEAIQKQGEAFRDAELAEKDYLAQLDATQKAEKAYTEYEDISRLKLNSCFTIKHKI